MSVLLDTHIWIWWLAGDARLAERERASLDELAGDVAVSAMSLWEAQMLWAKRRFVPAQGFDAWIRVAASPSVAEVLPLDVDVVTALDRLPSRLGGDPADRVIVATARAHDLPLATHDRKIRGSRTARLWRAA